MSKAKQTARKQGQQYLIINTDTLAGLQALVQNYVDMGGVPCGGPFNCPRHVEWVQAILIPTKKP